MPIEEYGAAQFALNAIQEGLSARQGVIAFREAGGRIANATWYRLTGEIQAMLAAREGVLDEPVNLVPTAHEITQWTTAKAKGFIQQAEVLVRDKTTGQIMSIPYSRLGTDLTTRRNVLAEALTVYTAPGSSSEDQEVLGAVYTGTYQATPEQVT
jgi:hypothetical protein